jgi:hypothetical protein
VSVYSLLAARPLWNSLVLLGYFLRFGLVLQSDGHWLPAQFCIEPSLFLWFRDTESH